MKQEIAKIQIAGLLHRMEDLLKIKPTIEMGQEITKLIKEAEDMLLGEKEQILFNESTDDIHVPLLQSIFNHLNGESDGENAYYQPARIDGGKICFPTTKVKASYTEYYEELKEYYKVELKDIAPTKEGVNSLLELMENTLSFTPSIAEKETDISFYDHARFTAIYASCRYAYLHDRPEQRQERAQGNENIALLYSIDVSGIQDFIYTIHSSGALKSLRARSFYLEIFMENMIDDILEKVGMSRVNVLYSGGGHFYMMLPNTQEIKEILDNLEKERNNWLREKFDISLYVAGAYIECSALSLQNQPVGSYRELFFQLSEVIGKKKLKRYTGEELLSLNGKHEEGRECISCKRVAKVNSAGKCDFCKSIEDFSTGIIKATYFSIISKEEEKTLPLGKDQYLIADTEEGLQKRIISPEFVRTYCKNQTGKDKYLVNKLWVGDYAGKEQISAYTTNTKGVSKIAALRLDVDFLGDAFVSGFENENTQDKYVTIARTAEFSRMMSLFFKYYINDILRKSRFCEITRRKVGTLRNVSIVYSGGDDVFLIGAWDDTLEAAIDIQWEFRRFTQGKLSVSGGMGIYNSKYPVHRMAEEVAELEEYAKEMEEPDKNAITLFDTNGRYHWESLVEKVVNEKFVELRRFFKGTEEHGKGVVYRILELIRNQQEKINFARYVYLLASLEPINEKPKEYQGYMRFSEKMYGWIRGDEERRELITAIYLYIYTIRNEEEERR